MVNIRISRLMIIRKINIYQVLLVNISVNGSIKNLSTIVNLAKFKKPDLIKSKRLNWPKDYVKANSSKTDFLTLRAGKALINL